MRLPRPLDLRHLHLRHLLLRRHRNAPSPYFLSRTLKNIGLFTGKNTMVMRRFLLFRTQTTFDHPIDMGNSCMLVTALIFILAMTTSIGNKKPIVALAILAGLCSSFSSLSVTASWVAILPSPLASSPRFGSFLSHASSSSSPSS